MALYAFDGTWSKVQDAAWFALIGAQGDNEKRLFALGDSSKSFIITKNSDLYLFANDLPFMYFNNENSLKVTITRTDSA